MSKIRSTWQKTDINQLAEFLYLATLAFYLLKALFDTTLFYIPWPGDYDIVLFIITCGVVMLKAGCSRTLNGLSLLFCAVMVIAFGIAWWHTAYNYLFLLYIPVHIIGAMDVDYKKILRIAFWINAGTLALAFIGSCSGVVRDLSYEVASTHRHSFGIVYPTDFAARIFFLLLAGWVLYENAHIIVSVLTVIFWAWFINYFCRARCSGIALFLLIAAILYEYFFCKKELVGRLPIRIIDRFCVWSTPIFAMCMIGFSLIYDENIHWMAALDNMVTQRLSLSKEAINQYGFTLFGTAFAQEGAGGTTAYNFFYNFLDSSYVLIVLRYGVIVFGLLLTLAVYQNRIVLSRNHRKLLLAGVLVGVHGIVEHHMPEINYNIFIILPFAAFPPSNEAEEKLQSRKGKVWWKRCLPTLVGIGVLLLLAPLAMRYTRTLVCLLGYHEPEKHIVFLAWCFIAAVTILRFIYRVKKLWRWYPGERIEVRNVAGLILLTVLMLVFAATSTQTLLDGETQYAVTIQNEKQILEDVLASCERDVALYVSDVPGLYKEKMKQVTDRFLPVEVCDLEKGDVILIAPIEEELNNLFQSGYYFGQLSSDHGIYTNTREIIDKLNAMGIGMTDYYSVYSPIDMWDVAAANNLAVNENGGLFVSGPGMSIGHGPWISLSRGRYSIIFDIQLTRADSYEIGVAKVTSDSGRTWWEGREVTWADFDENGHGIIRFDIGFWCDVNNAEFLFLANDQIDMIVNSIECRKTGSLKEE